MRRLIVFLFLFIVASPAVASDGVREINRACVSNGCFPGDDPGLPVQITEQGSYALTSNLIAGLGTTAISIQEAGVTLDLRGFSIGPCVNVTQLCPVLNVQDGIDGAGANDVTIRNGVVEGFRGDGVVLGQRALVEDMVIRTNDGAGLRVAQNSILRNNRIAFNDGVGASLGFGTIWGGNVLTNNSPDFSGNPSATAANRCTGAECGTLGRRFYLSTGLRSQSSAASSCGSGYRLARSFELEDPSNLTYADTPQAVSESLVSQGTSSGWLADEPFLSNCLRWTWDPETGWEKQGGSCGSTLRSWCISE